eukprot:COSAG01_NODE_1056_length_11893_cov_439.683332_18_plen_74_part_00
MEAAAAAKEIRPISLAEQGLGQRDGATAGASNDKPLLGRSPSTDSAEGEDRQYCCTWEGCSYTTAYTVQATPV